MQWEALPSQVAPSQVIGGHATLPLPSHPHTSSTSCPPPSAAWAVWPPGLLLWSLVGGGAGGEAAGRWQVQAPAGQPVHGAGQAAASGSGRRGCAGGSTAGWAAPLAPILTHRHKPTGQWSSGSSAASSQAGSRPLCCSGSTGRWGPSTGKALCQKQEARLAAIVLLPAGQPGPQAAAKHPAAAAAARHAPVPCCHVAEAAVWLSDLVTWQWSLPLARHWLLPAAGGVGGLGLAVWLAVPCRV